MTIPTGAPALGLSLTDCMANTPPFGDASTKVANMAAIAAAIAAVSGGSLPFQATVLRRQTVDATTLQLTKDGLVQGASNILLVGADKTVPYVFTAAARDAANGDSAHWFGWGLTKRVGATMTLPANVTWTGSWAHRAAAANFAPTPTGTPDTAAQAWRLQLDVVSATGQLVVRGTGEAAKTIDWAALLLWLETP